MDGATAAGAIEKETVRPAKDPQAIRVRAGDPKSTDPDKKPTNPEGLARSILRVLEKHEYVQVYSVGPHALNITMAGYRCAKERFAKVLDGWVLICTQSEYVADIGGKPTLGVCTRMYPVPIKYAL
ncbi:MAG: hypothetical protein JSS66_05270 [Armatimonadetes bacterium]|nr:hypothetical protein [Armatimonadota bacterium]